MSPAEERSPVGSAAPRLVLASASPRRHRLVEDLGLGFVVVVPDVDESVQSGERPEAYVARVAAAKADAVAHRPGVGEGDVVLAADTTVEVDGDILGKPDDADDAARMLRRLSGRTHRVHTALVVRPARGGPGWGGDVGVEPIVVTTEVDVIDLDDALIRWYVHTGEPHGKAGAYAIQGVGATLVAAVRGSVTNVIGLPAAETRAVLARHGFHPAAT